MMLTGTTLLKRAAMIIGLLVPTFSYAVGLDVNWTGPKQLTIKAQPDGLGGSANICKAGKTIYFYAILNTAAGNKQRMIFSASGIASGSCADVLKSMLPKSFTLSAQENYFFGFGFIVGSRPADGVVNVSLEYQSGTGNGWKPQPPPGPACSLVGSSVNISYGDLKLSEVAGYKKSAPLYVNCNAKQTVKVTLIGYLDSSGIKLRPDGSLTAKVLIREQAGNVGSVENVPAMQTITVPITSELKVNGNLAGGDFRGSSVINMEIY
ncbi:TPA: hypothetical protein ACKP1B_004223 [Serratia fonticola]